MKRRILSVGHMEFPLGLAQVQRQLLIAKAIMLGGYDVTVLCRHGIHREEDGIENEGEYEGVHYVYCSGSSIRPRRFLRRNLKKIKGICSEINYYRKFSRNKELAAVIISTNNFYNILFYFFLGKIFRVISVVDNVEYWTSNVNFRGLERFDKLLYDKYYCLFSDKVICISDFLIARIKTPNCSKILKVPVITDFDKFKLEEKDIRFIKEKYILFCGSVAYSDVIDFVISSYEMLGSVDFFLIVITKNTEKLQIRLNTALNKNHILVLENLPYKDLVNLYLYSEALLIPLRDTDQDKARFPHKISEYTAAGRPIITTKVGEILNYFDESNAYLCDNYDEKEFAEKIREVVSNRELSEQRAKKSYQMGLHKFNYKSYSKSLIEFIVSK